VSLHRKVALCVVLPAIALGVAFADALSGSVRVSPACSVLPNGRVIDLGRACPLQTHDLVVGLRRANGLLAGFEPAKLEALLATAPDVIEVEVRRGDRVELARVPVARVARAERLARAALALVICGALLVIPLGARRSRETAAVVPLALLNATSATLLVALVALPDNHLYRLAIGACAVLPAATAHLGFAFPLPRPRILGNPVGIAAPYLVSLSLVLPLFVAFERDSLYWPEAVWVVCFFGISAWLLIVVACALAIRESDSPLERARARLLCWGALFLPALLTAGLAPSGATPTDLAMVYWISATTVLTFPIALAVSRYNLFSLGDDLRQGVTAGLRFALSSALVGGVALAGLQLSGLSLSAQRPWPVLAGSVLAVAVLEPTRRGVGRVLEGYLRPSAERLASVQTRFGERLAELHDAHAVTGLLARSVEQALAGRHGWVFLGSLDRLVPVAAVGSPGESMRPDLAQVARALADAELLQLDAAAQRSRAAAAPVGQGVDLLVRIEHRGRVLGALLLGGPASGSGYSDRELGFVRSMARQAALALHNATLAEALVASESQSARATFAAGLLHDLGKQINWIRMIAARLPGRLEASGEARRDLESVARLSRELSRRIREFIVQPHAEDEPRSAPVERVVERACEAIARIHAGERIAVSLPPDARRVPADLGLVQVLVNLLDNALLASEPGEPVQLSVQRVADDRLAFRVTDRGVGLDHLAGRDPFRLGFSTRTERGGTGTGLAYAQATVEALGGTIRLEPAAPRGARAEVRVPVPAGDLRLAAPA